MEALAALVYRSTHTSPLTPTALHLLVQRARIRNVRLAVTGALLYDGTRFMQCLEGPKAAVDLIYSSITEDDRHKGISLLYQDKAERRNFEKWSMGFVSIFADDRLAALRGLGLDGQFPTGTPRQLLSDFLRAQATTRVTSTSSCRDGG